MNAGGKSDNKLDRVACGAAPRGAQATFGRIRLASVTPAPEPYVDPRIPEAGPANALNIFDVLVTRCAGHRDCPDATEVVEGIASRAPTEQQLRAIWVFIRASTTHDVRKAWKAGEFSMTNLMEKIERWFDCDDIALMRAIHEWMWTVEEKEP